MSRNKATHSKGIPSKAIHSHNLGMLYLGILLCKVIPSKAIRNKVTLSRVTPSKGIRNTATLNKDTPSHITNHPNRYLNTTRRTFHLEGVVTILLSHQPLQRVVTVTRLPSQRNQSNQHLSQRNPPRLRSPHLNPQSWCRSKRQRLEKQN